ncbi:DUF6790 family protein [Ferruginibacter profundus]
MADNTPPTVNKKYIIVVTVFTFLLPLLCTAIEVVTQKSAVFSFELLGKWFIFSAVGLRLFVAGIKQSTDPAFTAKEIFHLNNPDSFPIVRELGFANLCFGLTGIISLFMPQWRMVSAFGSGLYYGIAGLQHLIKKPAGANEKFALVTDIIIFFFLLAYFLKMM